MTQQEFVKKESEYYAECFRMVVEHSSWYHQKTEPFKSGLTKGLEIAKEALKYARENTVNGNDGCWDFNPNDQILQSLTDEELLTIFINEKYGQ